MDSAVCRGPPKSRAERSLSRIRTSKSDMKGEISPFGVGVEYSPSNMGLTCRLKKSPIAFVSEPADKSSASWPAELSISRLTRSPTPLLRSSQTRTFISGAPLHDVSMVVENPPSRRTNAARADAPSGVERSCGRSQATLERLGQDVRLLQWYTESNASVADAQPFPPARAPVALERDRPRSAPLNLAAFCGTIKRASEGDGRCRFINSR